MMQRMPNMDEYPCGNCAKCPLVKGMIKVSEDLREGAEHIGQAAVGEGPEEVAEHVFEMLPEGMAMFGPDGEPRAVESADDIVTALRSKTATFLEGIDEKRDEVRADIDRITEGCYGPLTMRAARAGQLVMVTVCMSPEAPEDSQVTEHAVVYRGNKIG